MTVRCYYQRAVGSLILGLSLVTTSAPAAAPASGQASVPPPDVALRFKPVQPDIDYAQPAADEVAKCKVTVSKADGQVGWTVVDSNGITLRRFIDTNKDNYVDQWCYYKDGLEVYRDIDSNFNGTADQYRWFNTAGSRWGVDTNEDGKLDAWKAISAEEVTAEVVAAIATRDAARFARVALTPQELSSLGLGAERSKQLSEKLNGLAGRFQQWATQQKEVSQSTKWLQFSGNQPGIVPAGTDGSSRDLRVYENVVAVLQSGNDHGQLQIGTLIEVGPVWRVIDLPTLDSPEQANAVADGFFFKPATVAERTPAASGAPSEEAQQSLADLEKLDAAIARAQSVEEAAKLNAQRTDLMEAIAEKTEKAEDRQQWLRQLADTVSGAAQAGQYPAGAERLEALCKKLEQNPQDRDLAAYVRYRQLQADYARDVQSSDDFVRIQSEWLKNLESYVATYPKSPDTADAMLQLGQAKEFAGQDEEAKKWYSQAVSSFSDSPLGRKAAGAIRRLDSVGKVLNLQGRNTAGGELNLGDFRGKVVLIQYWSATTDQCKADMVILKDLLAKYGRSGFVIVGVNLDNNPQEAGAFINQNRIAWPQIYEEGGSDSRPAIEMGILSVPTMLLVDQQGRVINRNIQAAEVDRELKRLLK